MGLQVVVSFRFASVCSDPSGLDSVIVGSSARSCGSLTEIAYRMPWGDDMGTQLSICKGHKAAITCCQMTHTGGGLLSAAEDWTIILWDVLHGAVIREFVGHKGSVTKVLAFPSTLLCAAFCAIACRVCGETGRDKRVVFSVLSLGEPK